MKTKVYRTARFLLALTICLFTVIKGWPSELILPSGAQNTEGNRSMDYPLGLDTGKIQQLYPKENFSSTEFVIDIIAVSFRVDNTQFGHIHKDFSDIRVVMSTTVNALTTAWASNPGADQKVVFSGPIRFDSDYPPTGGPASFDIRIPFQTPFRYDVSSGNLLLDVSHSEISGAGTLDAFATGGQLVYGSSLALEGQLVSDFMIATKFEYTVVPEPASNFLLIGGTAVLLSLRKTAWL